MSTLTTMWAGLDFIRHTTYLFTKVATMGLKSEIKFTKLAKIIARLRPINLNNARGWWMTGRWWWVREDVTLLPYIMKER